MMSFLFCSRNNVSSEMKVNSRSECAVQLQPAIIPCSAAHQHRCSLDISGGIYTFPSSLDMRGFIFDILRCWKFSSHSHFMRNSRIKRVQ